MHGCQASWVCFEGCVYWCSSQPPEDRRFLPEICGKVVRHWEHESRHRFLFYAFQVFQLPSDGESNVKEHPKDRLSKENGFPQWCYHHLLCSQLTRWVEQFRSSISWKHCVSGKCRAFPIGVIHNRNLKLDNSFDVENQTLIQYQPRSTISPRV